MKKWGGIGVRLIKGNSGVIKWFIFLIIVTVLGVETYVKINLSNTINYAIYSMLIICNEAVNINSLCDKADIAESIICLF